MSGEERERDLTTKATLVDVRLRRKGVTNCPQCDAFLYSILSSGSKPKGTHAIPGYGYCLGCEKGYKTFAREVD